MYLLFHLGMQIRVYDMPHHPNLSNQGGARGTQTWWSSFQKQSSLEIAERNVIGFGKNTNLAFAKRLLCSYRVLIQSDLCLRGYTYYPVQSITMTTYQHDRRTPIVLWNLIRPGQYNNKWSYRDRLLRNINIKHVKYISIRDWTTESSSWVYDTNTVFHGCIDIGTVEGHIKCSTEVFKSSMVIPSLFRSLKWSIVIDINRYVQVISWYVYQPYRPGLNPIVCIHEPLQHVHLKTQRAASATGLGWEDTMFRT